jgi:transcriptional regulator with GAF, ATPase, and Fis domain/tetratricopeptide (TPR) repeat protein
MSEVARDDSASRPSRPSAPPPPSQRRPEPPAVPAQPPPVVASPAPSSPLVELQARLNEGREAMLLVTASDGATRSAAAGHAARLLRLRTATIDAIAPRNAERSGGDSVRLVHVARADRGELVDALARALDLPPSGQRVGRVAELLSDAVRRGRTSVVVRVDEPASQAAGWVALVLRELAAALAPLDERAPAPISRVVFVAPPSCSILGTLGVPSVSLGPRLEPGEVWAWIESVARAFGRTISGGSPTLPALEGALARDELRDALRDVASHPTKVESTEEIDASSVDDEASPWTWLRRATRALEQGDDETADAAIARAEECADDPDARRDVGRRWAELLEPLTPRTRLRHARASTRRALEGADAEDAVAWAKHAVRAGELANASYEEMAALLEAHGRALVAKGDVVMARAVLARARERALAATLGAHALASIAVETAEAAYLAGDLASSESEARRAVAEATSPDVRLRARNVLGKILLAKGAWELADAHFASDATDAARVGDKTAELRALLNRAIALLSAERLEEAEGLFQTVLEAGANEPRAQALTLENLAIIASMRREYGLALERYRAAIAGLKKLGQAAMIAGAAHNLGYLYLRLGDVTQASSMVRYAATLFRRGLAAPVVAEGDDLRARIAARMGRSEEALAAISHAREILRAAGEDARVADCDRLEARLALDDGDVRGARLALDRARDMADSPRGKAEHALLEAEWVRANGGDGPAVLVAAREALALCRASTDEDFIVEAHLLVAEVARVTGDRELLQRHVEAAAGVRDAMLRSIPESYHATFVARPDMVRLAKLERLLESEPIPVLPPAVTSESAGARVRITEVAEPRRMIGNDPALRSLQAAVRRVAASDTTVLVQGESGTGKELVAEQLHFASERATGPLVKVNCAALVETLLLSELFGHEKGAFTGAVARRRGRFELADGGTLFLDEIGDISARTQVALLRVMQEKTFERVGGTTPIHVDVRIVCATHRDLATMVSRGEFREDLYYRLRGVQLVVPPLRARVGDLGDLCVHILKRIAGEHNQTVKGISRDALELLAAHKWPGNVRELENILRAVALLADGPEIGARDLLEHVDVLRTVEPPPAPSVRAGPASVPVEDDLGEEEGGGALPTAEASATADAYGQIRTGAVSLFEMKRMIERDCIARALAETRGNITRAAALLGMKRPRLSQLVKHYGLSAVFTEGS